MHTDKFAKLEALITIVLYEKVTDMTRGPSTPPFLLLVVPNLTCLHPNFTYNLGDLSELDYTTLVSCNLELHVFIYIIMKGKKKN